MNFTKIFNRILRRYGTAVPKVKITPSENVLRDLENLSYKPRKHPGVNTIKTVSLPDNIISAIEYVCQDRPIKSLFEDSIGMCNHLKNRVPQMEQDEISELRQNIFESVFTKESTGVVLNSEQDMNQFKQRVKDKVFTILKKKVYNWESMQYDQHKSLVYLIGRAAPEYSVLVKIFNEIKSRDTLFEPRSFFDFGAGVGTGTWAVKYHWKNSIFEYFNVDTSAFMNDLSLMLLKDGKGTKQINETGIFYRQFLPANNTSYDIVLAAYSMSELPNVKTRMETLLNLWNKTEHYLILVEYGTNGGFKIINEARDFLLHINKEQNIEGHIFCPCPHDFSCPRFLLADKTPCNFVVKYQPLNMGERNSPSQKELFSYVILKKGPKLEQEFTNWPRIVRETLVRNKHCICRVCSANGKLEELIFTAKKNGKSTYHFARSSNWGDLLDRKSVV